MQGLFITFEGADGSGKSTQIELIAEWFRARGRETVITREPGGTKASERIREIVLDPKLPINARTETLLYLAARAEHVARLITPALTAGKVVLCDRFCDSTIVYQGVSRGMDREKIIEINSFATGGLCPDLTFLMDADPEKLAARRVVRGIKDRFELEGLDFQKKVREGFLALAEAEPQRFRVVDALGSVDEVKERILRELEDFVAGYQRA